MRNGIFLFISKIILKLKTFDNGFRKILDRGLSLRFLFRIIFRSDLDRLDFLFILILFFRRFIFIILLIHIVISFKVIINKFLL